MIPQNHKIDFGKCNNRSKGLDCENDVYHKYGKDYLIKDYVNEYRDGTSAKEIIAKAGGLQNLPHAIERIKDSEITIDMNEDLFTINRKLKLGAIAQRKIDAAKAAAEAKKAAAAAQQATENQPKEDKGE